MAYPTDVVATGDLITAAQINRWCVLLADTTLSVAAASIDFTSIPAHWTSLLLVFSGQTDAGSTQVLRARFNADAAADYDRQAISGIAATAAAAEGFAENEAQVGSVPDDTAGYLGQSVIWLPDYASTTLNKGYLALFGRKAGTSTGTLTAQSVAGWHRSTDAIGRITLSSASGNLAAGSRASLYGMGRV